MMTADDELRRDMVNESWDAGYKRGWQDCLDMIRGTLQEYPIMGGDEIIMGHVDRLIREAVEKTNG